MKTQLEIELGWNLEPTNNWELVYNDKDNEYYWIKKN
jgi:hypothetical protein